jgi:hypothetical protein
MREGFQRLFGSGQSLSFGQTRVRRMGGVRYLEISPPLPVESTVSRPNRFSFGLPWPWIEVREPGGVVSGTGDEVQIDLLAEAYCPRTDGLSVGFGVWAENETMELPQFGRQSQQSFSQLYRGQSEGTINILLGGIRAVVSATATSSERILRMMSEWHDRTLHAEFRSPLAYADSYKPHFETIVGSWTWL